jgi:hypothetical protein
MSTAPDHSPARLRWGVYLILIAVAVGQMTGRLMAVNSVDLTRVETNRVNERLRQERQRLTAEGLLGDELERGLLAAEGRLREELRLQRPFLSANDRSRWMTVRSLVEHGTYEIDAILEERTWDTIDKVRHVGRDGEMHYYSSKPPLLATMVAGLYWPIHRATGWTLGDRPYEIGRAILFGVNIVPLAVMFGILAWLAERFGVSDWDRIFMVAAATLGTFLNTFAIVLNNHVVAAVGASVALFALVRITSDGERGWKYFALAGAAAAFTAANELPAAAFLVGVGAILFIRAPRATLLAFAPAALVAVVAFFATNWIAHQDLRPPYMHPEWYDYLGSYWNNRQGIDIGEASRTTYALHVLVGHHGILSLTPMWLLSMAGMAYWLWSSERARWELAALAAVLTIICLVFYIAVQGQGNRNYGGTTSVFRWMLWLAPLWLLAILPAAERLARSSLGKVFAALLLALSAMSASYPTWNPWTHPWLHNFVQWSGWLE